MIRLFTLFTLLFLLSTNNFAKEHLKGAEASNMIPGAIEVWYKSNEVKPHYVRFDPELKLQESEATSWLRAQFDLKNEMQFKNLRSHIGATGIKHTSYSLIMNDVPFEFVRITVHSINGIALSVSGNFLASYEVKNNISLSEEQALDFALREINSDEYKWEIPGEEQWIKETSGNANATFFPVSSIVVVSKEADYKALDLRYAHKFDVYSNKPFSREEIYVDAESGEILFRHDLMREIDTLGIAHTGFSGIQQITTDHYSPGGTFRLREEGRGNGINTWNIMNSTDFSTRVDFTDDDNTWKDKQNMDEFATDAHWGAEVTYDYFKYKFGRNGIDDHGYQLNNYVHFGESFDNALWDGQQMIYGDGNSNPYTTVDIAGHEISHGLTDFTADLVYMNESGALNESFSDIFGNCIEKYAKPSSASWRIGEDRGSFVRDMSDPNLRYNPDTYEGVYWYVGTGDNGGVHINSGVQNYWFYLLTDGGIGINDDGDAFDVQGIGFASAAEIAYENLTSYLSPLSDYEEARFYSIMAAVDLFGNCSVQHKSVVNAWYAVGLGDEFVDHAIASFNADRLDFCNPPFVVDFNNLSTNGVNYRWEFGDGGSSTDENPSHTYETAGEFNVKLSIDGDGCGIDEKELLNYIKTVHPDSPTAENEMVETGHNVTLNASSNSGVVYWYKDASSPDILHMGNQFITGPIMSDSAFFMRSVVTGSTNEMGEDVQNSLNLGSYSNSGLSMIFDMMQGATLHAVTVNAGTEGERTFAIKDKIGTVIFEKTVNLESGIQEIVLDAKLVTGSDYELYVAGTMINLWRSTNAHYPYEIPGLCGLNENSNGLDSIYPYFYNWKIQENDCTSEVIEVSVGIDDNLNGNKNLYNFYTGQEGDGRYSYFVRFNFLTETTITYGLYNISGQKVLEYTPPAYGEGPTQEIDLNQLLDLESNSGGVYFLTFNGGEIEKSERIIIKTGGN